MRRHSDGNEADIVHALRIDGVLTVSLVAEDEGKIVGHVAFSPVAVNSQDFNWFGLGPVAVLMEKRRCGMGAALIEAGLKRLKELGARGCVVLGDPVYYHRFGFERDSGLRFANDDTFDKYVREGVLPAPKRRGTLTRWKWSEIEAALDGESCANIEVEEDAFERGTARVKEANRRAA